MNLEPLLNEAKARMGHRLPYGTDIDILIESSMQNITDAVMERVAFSLEQAMLGAQSVLKSQSDEYISGLKLNDDLTISIDESVRYLEDGYGPHEMLDNLLTGPKSKLSKDGNLYNRIPIGSANPTDIKRAMGKQVKDFLGKSNSAGTSRRKLQDIVGSMVDTINNTNNIPKSKPDVFVTASSKQDAGTRWVHPGFAGVRQLDQINNQLRSDIIETIVNIIESASYEG